MFPTPTSAVWFSSFFFCTEQKSNSVRWTKCCQVNLILSYAYKLFQENACPEFLGLQFVACILTDFKFPNIRLEFSFSLSSFPMDRPRSISFFCPSTWIRCTMLWASRKPLSTLSLELGPFWEDKTLMKNATLSFLRFSDPFLCLSSTSFVPPSFLSAACSGHSRMGVERLAKTANKIRWNDSHSGCKVELNATGVYNAPFLEALHIGGWNL